MEKRAIFPVIMFAMAGISFGFGIWQYAYARSVAASSATRMAYIMTTIEKSPVSRASKRELYASIMDNLPSAPAFLGIDLSGSFASQTPGDACTSEGQRTICRALTAQQTDRATMTAICGACTPP